MSVATLAAANGLDPAGILVAGSSLAIPAAAAAPRGGGGAPPAAGRATRCAPGDSLSASPPAPASPVADIAAMNGLDPDGVLLVGTVLKLPSGAPAPARSAEPAPAPVVPAADPVPTATSVGAADIQSVAAQYGVSPSLAAAIAWQESGFNNAMVSSANARGVMQVMPGTWDYVERNLAGGRSTQLGDRQRPGRRAVPPPSAEETGGDEATAAAAYYQGLQSVRDRGLYDDTQQYVANVQALRSRFGG